MIEFHPHENGKAEEDLRFGFTQISTFSYFAQTLQANSCKMQFYKKINQIIKVDAS